MGPSSDADQDRPLERSPTPRLAIVVTDLVDSTATYASLGDKGAARLSTRLDRVTRDLVRSLRGREIDKSDGFLLLFDDVGDAVRFAGAYHARLAEESAKAGKDLRARVGVHVGHIIARENPKADVALGAKPVEVEGIAKPIAARIMSLAVGGQTLLSDAAAHALETAGTIEGTLVTHGLYRLKGLDGAIGVREHRVDGGAPSPPPADAPKAYRVTRLPSGDLVPVRDVPSALPRELATAFFGRAQELESIADAFDRGASIVTLTGPGGTGKTRLALRFGHARLGDFWDGTYFVDLSDARSARDVATAVALALSVPRAGDDASGIVKQALVERGSVLLILDNFEQIVACAPQTVGAWAGAAPHARFLITSRESLRIDGETRVAVAPLPLPAEDDGPAVLLFVDRARAAHPAQALDGDVRPHVRRLVALLDGVPLAIELAAARAGVMGPEAMCERLVGRLDLLRSVQRGVAARQATLEATLDWSFALLSAAEQASLAQCSLFRGGFTLEAAEAVVEVPPGAGDVAVVDLVQGLVDKSLLVQAVDEAGRPRIRMLRTIATYAESWLERYEASRGVVGAAAARHARFFARGGTEESVRAMRTLRVIPPILFDRENLEAALEHAVAVRDAERAALVVLALAEVWLHKRVVVSLPPQIEAAVALPDLPPRLRLRIAHVELRLFIQSLARSRVHELEATVRRLGEQVGDPVLDAWSGAHLGRAFAEADQLARGRDHLERAGRLLSAHPDAACEASVCVSWAYVEGVAGDLGAALDWARRGVARAVEADEPDLEIVARHAYADTCLWLEPPLLDEALHHFQANVALGNRIGRRANMTEVMLASTLTLLGRFDQALAAADRALAAARAGAGRRVMLGASTERAVALGALGRVDEALAQLAEAENLSSGVPGWYRLMLRVGEAEVLARSGTELQAQNAITAARIALATLGVGGELLVRVERAERMLAGRRSAPERPPRDPRSRPRVPRRRARG